MDSAGKSDPTIPMPSAFVSASANAASPPPSTPPQVKLNMASTLAMVAAAAANNGGATPATLDNGSGVATVVTQAGGAAATVKKGAVRYRECLKNHAAGIGGHALDGCGEFMPNKEDETCMRCAACDCHRNFHRREVEGEKPPPLCELCRSGRRGGSTGGGLLTPAGGGGSGAGDDTPGSIGGSSLKKRFRTKFSGEQKERMYMLSEKLGWRIQKHDEAEVAQFCADTGVKRHVLKVWMHNNKHTFGNRKSGGGGGGGTSSPSSTSHHHHHHHHQQD